MQRTYKKRKINSFAPLGYYSLIPQEELDVYIERINNATTKKEVEGIKAELDLRYYQINMIGAAKEEVVFLEGEALEAFITRIEEATSITEVQDIFAELRVADNEEGVRQAEALMETLDRLTDEQKQGYLNRIYRTNSAKVVREIMDEAIKANAEAPEPIERIRAEAIATIRALENLFNAEKTRFVNRVYQATTIEEIEAIVEEAIQKDAENLQKAKDQLIRTINNGYYSLIPQEELDEYIERINNATTKKEIEGIKAELDLHYYQINMIGALKEEAVFLEGEALEAFITRIENAGTIAEVQTIISEFHVADYEEGVRQAEALMETLDRLTDEQKQGYLNRIYRTNSAKVVRQIMDEAIKANSEVPEDPLAALKEEAKVTIDSLEYISDEEKETYKARIDEATSEEEIQAIVDEATEKNFEVFKEASIAILSDKSEFPYLKDSNRLMIEEMIRAAETEDEVMEALMAAVLMDMEEEQLVLAKRASAIEEINSMDYLDAEQKDAYIARINEAMSVALIDEILEEARNEKPEEEDHEAYIQGLPFLLQIEKDAFIQRLADATEEEIEAIRAEAEALNISFEKAKVRANIYNNDQYSNLKHNQRVFRAKIDAATTMEELDAIIAELDAVVLANVKEKQQQLLKFLDEQPYIPEEEKEALRETVLATFGILKLNRVEEQIKIANALVHYAIIIRELEYLTDEEKELHITQMGRYNNLSAIEGELSLAQFKNLEKGSEIYRNKIAALPNMIPEIMRTFNSAILNTNRVEDLPDLLERAIEVTNAYLKEQQDAAVVVIESLDKLTDSEKEDFIARIHETPLVVQIEILLSDAHALHATNWINTLPTVEELVLTNRLDILAVRALLDTYTEETIGKVQNLDLFLSLEEKMRALEKDNPDNVVASEVNSRIAELDPRNHNEELYDSLWKAATKEILEMYDALTDEQKVYVAYKEEIELARERLALVNRFPSELRRIRSMNRFVETYTPSVSRSTVSQQWNQYKEVERLKTHVLIFDLETLLQIFKDRGFN